MIDKRLARFSMLRANGLFSQSLMVTPVTAFDFDEYELFCGNISGLESPVDFCKVRGRKLVDFISAGMFLNLMSSRMVEVFDGSKFSGFEVYRARILLDSKSEPVTDYQILAVKGRAGPVDWSRTPVVNARAVGGLELEGLEYEGLAFDVDSWDGTDLFTTTGNAYVICTERCPSDKNCAHKRCYRDAAC